MPSLPPISKLLGFGRLGFAGLPLLLALAGCQNSPSGDPRSAALDRIVAGEAVSAEQAGDHAGAARHYGSLYQSDRADPVVIEGLARNLRHAGDAANARAVLAEALARLGPQGRLLVEKGKAELALGEAGQAVSTLEAAVTAAPNDWEAPATLAVALDRLGRFGEAEPRYRAALALAADNPEILNNYALSRALAGRLDEAKALLRTAVALPGASARVRENLAFLETLQGRPPAAPARPRTPGAPRTPGTMAAPGTMGTPAAPAAPKPRPRIRPAAKPEIQLEFRPELKPEAP